MLRKYKDAIGVEFKGEGFRLSTDRLVFDNTEGSSEVDTIIGQSEFIVGISEFLSNDLDLDSTLAVINIITTLPEFSKNEEFDEFVDLKHIIYYKSFKNEDEYVSAVSITDEEKDIYVNEKLIEDFLKNHPIEDDGIIIVFTYNENEIDLYMYEKEES